MPGLKAIVINVDGTHEQVEIDPTPELKFLQNTVGGYIEAVYSDDGPYSDNAVTFWINEEGKLIGLPVNPVATALWWKLAPGMRGVDVLCGPCILTGGADKEGDTRSLGDTQVTALLHALEHPEEL